VVLLTLPVGGLIEAAAPAAPAVSTGEAGTAGPVAMVQEGEAPSMFAAVPTPDAVAAPVPQCCALALHFASPAVAQAWFKVLVHKMALTETSSTEVSPTGAPLVSDKTGAGVCSPSEADDRLLGAHFLAGADARQVALETEWVFPKGAAGSAEVHSAASALHDSLKTNLALPAVPTELPTSGLLLFKVLAVHEQADAGLPGSGELESSSAQMKGWMSCYVRVDCVGKTITFYDQGPGSSPSLVVSCEGANLHVPDVTDPALGYECNIYHCTVRNTVIQAKMSIAIKLPNAAELLKWSITLSKLLENVTYCTGGMVNSATQPIDYLQDSSFAPGPVPAVAGVDFPGAQPYITDICMGVLESLAERKMCSSYIRHVQLNGAQIKSARFLQMNQRIVLLMKGTCNSLTEGSVLLSVNGLSTVSTPASTILKFIADFPRQMMGEITMWKFPRMEFNVNVVKLTASASDHEPTTKVEPVRSTEEAAVVEEARPLDSKGKLNKVIIQKRNSILKISSGLEMSFEGIEHPSIIANLQNELKALDVSGAAAAPAAEGAENVAGFTLADFTRTPVAEVSWQSCRLMVASGNVSILVTEETTGAEVSLGRLQLSSCHMKLVYPTQGTSIHHLAVHLWDAKVNVVVQCASLPMFVDLLECLLIAMKMMGSHAADLAHLYDQSVHWGNAADRRQKAATTEAPSLAPSGVEYRSQSLLMQAVLESAEESREAAAPSTPMRTSVPAFRLGETPAGTSGPADAPPDANILQAAEALEEALSSLHLPPNFPTHVTLEKEMVELFKLNNANHRLLAEFLTLQFEVMNPVPEAAPAPVVRQKSFVFSAQPTIAEDDEQHAETKYPMMGGDHGNHSDARAGESVAEVAPGKNSSETSVRDKLVAALGAGGADEEKSVDNEKSRDGAQTTEDESADGVSSKMSPPSPKDTGTTSSVRRASVQMRSGSVMMSNVAPVTVQTTANRRATFRKSAITHSQEQAAVLLMSQMEKQIMLQVGLIF
jgi:hypothetical protein